MLAQSSCEEDREFWSAQLELAGEAKTNGNKKLMDCSTKYKERMVAVLKLRRTSTVDSKIL
jgi:hypothetical protein